MATIKVRPMDRNDRAKVKKILRNTPEFNTVEVEVAEELVELYLKNGTDSGYHVLVADADRTLIGYVCFGPTPLTEGTWDIYWIAVADDKRGQGIGRILLESAEEKVVAGRGRQIFIETSSKPGYENTSKFYKSMAYEQIARIPDFYAHDDDKLILRKRLV